MNRSPRLANHELRTGDRVKVKALQEIQRVLDNRGRFQGCAFSRRMHEYCGGEYKVLKPVTYFYDEAKQKICRGKNLFILENVTCNGKFRLFPEPCDRMCFLFWKSEWLTKIEEQAIQSDGEPT